MIEYSIEKNEARIGKQLAVFHCNHYNLTLQRTIMDAIGEKGKNIQINAARRSTEQMLMNVDKSERKSFAMNSFSTLGFGILECDNISKEGGNAKAPVSHYALAWYEKFGPNKEPVCYFNAGYILGIFNSISDLKLDASHIVETTCRVIDPENISSCVFEVKV